MSAPAASRPPGLFRAGFRSGLIRYWNRWSLWIWLVALVAALLVTLVWLAGRFEASQVQDKLDRAMQIIIAP